MPRLSTFTKLVVDDLDRITAGGGVYCDIRNFSDMKVRVAFATDPEGHLIEIVERSD